MLITGTILILSPILIYAAKSHWLWLNAPASILEQIGATLHTKLTNRGSSLEDVAIYLKETNWWGVFKTNLSGFFYRYGYLFFGNYSGCNLAIVENALRIFWPFLMQVSVMDRMIA